MSRPAHEVIIRPLVTEETSLLQFNPGRIRKRHADEDIPVRPRFAFQVVRDATKVEIRNAVESMFDVRVVAVNTMNLMGKQRRVGRHVGRRPDWKKAIVTLAEGETIDVFRGE
ncbi:MAG: 50S ribosomal protein L23 [Gemmatimonadota bacterium]|nr:50S ribosomal protein L23 [Gemmatimonadota bacterium]